MRLLIVLMAIGILAGACALMPEDPVSDGSRMLKAQKEILENMNRIGYTPRPVPTEQVILYDIEAGIHIGPAIVNEEYTDAIASVKPYYEEAEQ